MSSFVCVCRAVSGHVMLCCWAVLSFDFCASPQRVIFILFIWSINPPCQKPASGFCLPFVIPCDTLNAYLEHVVANMLQLLDLAHHILSYDFNGYFNGKPRKRGTKFKVRGVSDAKVVVQCDNYGLSVVAAKSGCTLCMFLS